MSFYGTILAHRRLAIALIGIAIAHLLIIGAGAFAVVRYQQFWAIAAVLWLPLITLSLRWTTGSLKKFFEARKDNVLAMNGVQVSRHENTETQRRLANIAEEISVATGGALPDTAVCQSQGTNAFIGFLKEGTQKKIAVIYTSEMVSAFTRHELQAVVAHLYAHRSNFEHMFITMVGAVYISVFAAADVFLILTTLNWNFGGSGDFATGPLVVILVMGMLYGPVAAAWLAQVYVLRHTRYFDDLTALKITHDPESLISALDKLSQNSARLEAIYDMAHAHFYFDNVKNPALKYPWQMLATHPRPAARAKALRTATGH